MSELRSTKEPRQRTVKPHQKAFQTSFYSFTGEIRAFGVDSLTKYRHNHDVESINIW